MNQYPSRRDFIQQASLGAASALTFGALGLSAQSAARTAGANQRVRVAVFGLNRRGKPLIQTCLALPGVDVACVVDVDSRRLSAGVAHTEKSGGPKPRAEKDLRRVLEMKDIDAVILTLPDHWHVPAALLALQAGKHVYCEKPVGHNPREGELLLAATQKYPSLRVQIGTQQRSSPETREIVDEIRRGVIGEAYEAVTFYNNSRGAVPNPKVVPPPAELDWELFQGPVPRRPFKDILEDYMWHWDWHYGTAETGNNANHELDVARWALGVTFPDWVHVNSGKYHFRDDGWEMYDTMDATFHFPGHKLIKWDGRSRNQYRTFGGNYGRGTIIYGTEGSVFVDREHYKLFDRSGKLVREKAGASEDGTALGGGGALTNGHVLNFIEAIRSGQPLNAPASEGVPTTHLAHYANISSRTGDQKLEIDPATGHFRDWKVMQSFWSREYAPGWEPTV